MINSLVFDNAILDPFIEQLSEMSPQKLETNIKS